MAKRIAAGENLRTFGEVHSFRVGESAAQPGKIQICQYASSLVGPLAPAQIRELAANLLAAADAVEAHKPDCTGAGCALDCARRK
jgi:hypothetical protein